MATSVERSRPGVCPGPKCRPQVGSAVRVRAARLAAFFNLLFAALVLTTISLADDQAEVRRNTNLRGDPSTSNPPLELLKPPQKVTVLDPTRTAGYLHVRAADGQEGWAWAKNLKLSPTGPTPIGGSSSDAFQAGCPLPYNSQPEHHLVDADCAATGSVPSSKPAGQEQNRRKNDLCEDASAPVPVGIATFEQLQAAVDTDGTFAYGNDSALNSNSSRAVLAAMQTVDANGNPVNLGEGKVVTLEAFVLHAKHDDVPLLNPHYHGESVNCKKDDLDFNDIHIALGQSGSDQECAGVTAEIIPHFRPASWDRFDNDPKTSPAVNGLPVKGLKVKITGPLFFDASHPAKPCGAPHSSNPARVAVWEIHPVYKIEVFDGSQYVSFDDWAGNH